MSRAGRWLDRAAGRVYLRLLAVLCGCIALVMLTFALFAWPDSRVGALIWLSGALVFGASARGAWRSRAGLSDVDFTG